ncbi:MAG: hypothetical protein WCC04_04315 [Terriglobales bacterium]
MAVEDGLPFCPQCRAPQIHVQMTVGSAGDGVVAEELPGRTQEIAKFDRPLAPPSLFDRGAATRAALKAGVLGVFVGMLIPMAGILLTGWMALYFYRRERGLAPGPAVGSRLGGAAGVVCFGINSILIVIEIFILHRQQQFIESVLKIAQAVGYNPADPEIQAAVHNLFTPSGLLLTFFFGMTFSVVLAALGGALAALILRQPPRG